MRETERVRGEWEERDGEEIWYCLFKFYRRLRDVNCCSVHISGAEILFVSRSLGSFGRRKVDDIISLMEHFISHCYADEVNFLPLILVWDTNRDTLHCRSGDARIIDDGGINGRGAIDNRTRRWKLLPRSGDWLTNSVMSMRWRQVKATAIQSLRWTVIMWQGRIMLLAVWQWSVVRAARQ